MAHREPARGALAGIRGDLKKAKTDGKAYDPRGVGSAWSHNFLNQKPWHPLNFRNQQRVWEAEQQKVAEEKSKEVALAEFQAEQEYLKTLAFVNKDEAIKQRDRQAVSFMYMKPPGYDAALKREKEKEKKQERDGKAEGPGDSGEAAAVEAAAQSEAQNTRKQARPKLPGEEGTHVGNVLQAIAHRTQQSNIELKHVSTIHGGIDPTAHNQQFVVASDEEEEGGPGEQAPPEMTAKEARRLLKARKKEMKKRQLEEAKQFLVAAGLLEGGEGEEGGGVKHKKNKKSKHKKHKKKKKRKHSSGDDDSSSSSE